jgi:hypothetical protein
MTSIVIALGITRILTGVGLLLEARNRIRVYWVHLLWALNIFLFLTLNWWILFRWEAYQDWNFFLFLFLLLSPTVAFLLSVILFPDPKKERMDFKQEFFENRRWFFALGATLPVLDLIDTSLKGYAHLAAQGPLYIVTIVLIFSLSIVAALTRNETYHKAFSIFFLCYLVTFISINLSLLQ